MLDLSIPNCMNNPLEISETFDANISQGILGYFDTNSEFDLVVAFPKWDNINTI